MSIAAVQSSTQAYDAGAARRLGTWHAVGRKVDARDPSAAREAASLLTSQLFFAPLLAEMRAFPFGKELGNGGRMEDVFGEQLDLRIADVVARGDRGLTAQLAEKLTRQSASLSPDSRAADAQLRQADAGGDT
jgi:hypothetical protein